MLHYVQFNVGFHFPSALSSHQQHVPPFTEMHACDAVKLNPVGVSHRSPLGFALDHTK